MLGMFGIGIMSENQLLNGYANGITPNTEIDAIKKIYAIKVLRLYKIKTFLILK